MAIYVAEGAKSDICVKNSKKFEIFNTCLTKTINIQYIRKSKT